MKDSHLLNFCKNIYCCYTEHIDELQLEEVKAAGCREAD
jgi:hypothetical protein